MNPTIKDIARETGLSSSTISKYLNNKPVLLENRIKIEAAIEKLHYIPNQVAQDLRRGNSNTVAIICSDLANYFWSPLISSVTKSFFAAGYNAIVRSYNHERVKERSVISDVISRGVRGVILISSDSLDYNYESFQKEHIPTVIVDQIPDDFKNHAVDCVISENYSGGFRLAEYLINKGHRHVYVNTPFKDFPMMNQRASGFVDAFRKHHLPEPIVEKPIRYETVGSVARFSRTCTENIMRQSDRPDAIFYMTHDLALGGMTAISSNNYKIPDDFSVVIFDDDKLFQSIYPPMTAVSQDLRQIGVTAYRILCRRIAGDYSDFPVCEKVPVIFHERQSVREIRR